MCGICGIVSSEGIGPGDRVALEGMCRTLRHRGPDDEGYYVDRWAALGMRRLSIIDLATGQQPVTNEEGKVWLVFNGEIYNYRELRQRFEREGHVFASQSDSEVIVHAYEAYGERCLQLLNGMFALAIWDTRRISADCVRRRGYFEAETVTRWVTEHLDGRANHSHRLWALMVFELWQRQVLGGGRK